MFARYSSGVIPPVALALGQGLPHDVEALEESAFLLTIAWPSEKDRPVL